MARGEEATLSLGFLDPIVQAFIGAFTSNPIYALIVIVIGFVVGWFLHYQVFGY